jgi:hypothetical protein
MNLAEIIEQLESCAFRCEAGPLERNVAFVALKAMVKPGNQTTILDSIGNWENMPLARVLFDLVQIGYTSKMDVCPANCESGAMASVRLEKEGSFSANFIGSTPAILKRRIIKWADENDLRKFLKQKEGHED